MPAQDLIIDLAIRYGFQVVGALVILFVGLLAAWWVGNVVAWPSSRRCGGSWCGSYGWWCCCSRW
jgi:hypothetical protein